MYRSVLIAVFAAHAAGAIAAPEPTFYLPFDGSLNAAYAKGKPTPSVAAADPILSLISESFAEGVVGKAALLGPPSATYESAGNWDWRQGTVAFWLKPSWPGDDVEHYRILFRSLAWGSFYKYTTQPYLTFGVIKEDQRWQYGCTTKPLTWKPGEWHHVAIAWSMADGFRRIHLDGQLAARGPLPSLHPGSSTFTIGGVGSYALASLVDELYIFEEPLTEEEIRPAYERSRSGKPAWELASKRAPSVGPPTSVTVREGRPPDFVNWALEGTYQQDNGLRGRICLNGWWRHLPEADLTAATAPDEPWLYRKVPGWHGSFHVFGGSRQRVRQWGGKRVEDWPVCWVERTFNVPRSWASRRIVLRITDVDGGRGHVYLDGAAIGKQIQMEPGEYDVTDRVTPGRSHTLTVLSGGVVDDVWLLSYPRAARVSDVRITSDVHSRALTLRGSVSGGGRISCVVSRDPGGQDIVKRGQVAASDSTWVVRVHCLGLRLWSPGEPNLYWLHVELRDTAGRLIDRALPMRFGFRDFKIRGGDFLLNGVPYRLRGHANPPVGRRGYMNASEKWIRQFCRGMKRLGLNAFYMMTSIPKAGSLDRVLDICDEEGLLAIPSPLHVSRIAGEWERPVVQDHLRKRLEEFVRRYRHHACVPMWIGLNGLSDTWDFCPGKMDGSYAVPMEPRQRAAIAGAKMVREIDPTRELFEHSTGAVGPVHSSMAYLGFDVELQEREDWPWLWYQRRHKPVLVSEFGLPVVCSWHQLKVPRIGLKKVYSSPSMFVEYAAMYFGDEPYRVEPEEAVPKYGAPWKHLSFLRYKSPAMGRVKKLFAKHGLRAWRAYGINWFLHAEVYSCFDTFDYRPEPPGDPRRPGPVVDHPSTFLWNPDHFNGLGEEVAAASQPILAYIGGPGREFTRKDHAFSAGERVRKQVVICNDTLRRIRAEVQWRAAKKLSGKMSASVGPGEIALGKLPIEFTAPEVVGRTSFTVQANVTIDSRRFDDRMEIEVFPAVGQPSAKRNLLVFDPIGDTTKLLKTAGVTIRPAVESLPREGTLVVGRHALEDAANVSRLDELGFDAAVSDGLNVVVFEQAAQEVLGLKLDETSPRRVFVRAPGHWLLRGLSDTDFRDWRGDSDLIDPWEIPTGEVPGKYHYPERFWKWGNRGSIATYVIRKPQVGTFRPLLDCGFDLVETPLLEYFRGKGRIIFCQLDVTNRYGTDPVATRIVDRLLSTPPDVEATRPACWSGPDELKAHLGLDPVEERAALTIAKESATALLFAPYHLPDGIAVSTATVSRAIPPATPIFWGLSCADFFLRKRTTIRVISSPTGPTALAKLPCGRGRLVVCFLTPSIGPTSWQRAKLTRAACILAANVGLRSALGPGVDHPNLYPVDAPGWDPYRYWRW